MTDRINKEVLSEGVQGDGALECVWGIGRF